MFGRANVYAMINGFTVRVKDAREKDKNHLIESKFEVPLSFELADEILPAMARDLFDRHGKEWTPKPEIMDASFDLNPDPQILTLKEHPELDPVVRIPGVTIRKVTAYKGEAGALLLGFTTTWTLGDEREPIAIIKRLKTGVYITTEAQQPGLADQSDQAPAEQEQALDLGTADAPEAEQAGDAAGNVEGAAGEVPQRNKRRRGNIRAVNSTAADA